MNKLLTVLCLTLIMLLATILVMNYHNSVLAERCITLQTQLDSCRKDYAKDARAWERADTQKWMHEDVTLGTEVETK